jgi:hypothetical protein
MARRHCFQLAAGILDSGFGVAAIDLTEEQSFIDVGARRENYIQSQNSRQ